MIDDGNMHFRLFSWVAIIAVFFFSTEAAYAEGLLYQLPEDGSWVQFNVEYTFRSEGAEQSGQQLLRMASVGKAFEASEECRWIEFEIRAKENGTERVWIRKLLIPVRYLKQGENPTLHVVRGWARQDQAPVEPAVPVHGRWPAFLAGPLHDEERLERQVVDTKLGLLECEGVRGWIEFNEGNLRTKVSFETLLHQTAPFGVVASRMVFEMRGEGSPYTIEARATLADFGTGARSLLPGFD